MLRNFAPIDGRGSASTGRCTPHFSTWAASCTPEVSEVSRFRRLFSMCAASSGVHGWIQVHSLWKFQWECRIDSRLARARNLLALLAYGCMARCSILPRFCWPSNGTSEPAANAMISRRGAPAHCVVGRSIQFFPDRAQQIQAASVHACKSVALWSTQAATSVSMGYTSATNALPEVAAISQHGCVLLIENLKLSENSNSPRRWQCNSDGSDGTQYTDARSRVLQAPQHSTRAEP